MTDRLLPAQRSAGSRPRLVTASVLAYVVVAVVNVGVGAWSLSFAPAVVQSLQRDGQRVPTQALVLAFVAVGAATVVFSGALVFFALRLRRGSTWARPALLTISVLSLAALISGGGPGLLVVVLCIVAAILVTRSPVSAWLRSMRGLRPA